MQKKIIKPSLEEIKRKRMEQRRATKMRKIVNSNKYIPSNNHPKQML